MIHTHQASDWGPGRLFLEAKMEDRRLDVQYLCSSTEWAEDVFFPEFIFNNDQQ